MGKKIKKSKTVSSSVCRVHKSKNFTLLSNSFLRSSNLSLASVGLLGRVMGLPEEWDYSIKGLSSICKEGETAIETVLKDLQEWGYLKISKLYPNETEDGRIHYVYDFYESSEKDKTLSCTVMAEGNMPSNKSKRCRVNKTDNFTIVSSLLLRSKEISLKSLGLLLRVLSFPDDWDYSVAGLVFICKEGKTAIDSALKELKNIGYLVVTKLYANMTASKGIEYVYDFFENPISEDEADKHREKVKAEAKAKVSGAELSTEMLKTADFSAPQEGEKQGVENLYLDDLPLEVLPTENRPQYNTKEQNKENKILCDEGSINQSAVSGTKAERFVENSAPRLIDGYITDKEKIKNIIKENIEYDEYVEWIELFGSDTMTVSGLDQIVSHMVRTAVSRRGRVIDDIVYSAQEVQDSLLRVNRACLDRGYDVMKKTMGIHKRDYDVKHFIKQKYFTADIACDGFTLSSARINDETAVNALISSCEGKPVTVKAVKKEVTTVSAPKLYDLTTLQREANKTYGYTAQQTLDYTQNLYEKKLVTYPRTDSQYLSDDMEQTEQEKARVGYITREIQRKNADMIRRKYQAEKHRKIQTEELEREKRP